MVKLKGRVSSKVLAIFLAVTLMLGMIPISLFSVFAVGTGTESFTITVEDSSASPLDGSSITLTKSDDVSETETGTTDASGEAIISNLFEADYFYEVTLAGYETATGSILISSGGSHTVILTVETFSATITTQPIGGNFKVDDPLNLSVAANNAKSYQWYKDSVIIPNADSATYQISNLALDDAATYMCKVTGTDDSETDSDDAVVTVSKIDTNIVLSIDPAAGQARPNSITLSADGLPADATGTIKFFNGATQIGTPQAIDGSVSFSASGKDDNYTLKVEYSGDTAKYNSSENLKQYDFTKGTQDALSITGLDTSYTYGDNTINLGTTGGTTNNTVVYESNNLAIATVSNNVVTIIGAGEFKITATMPGNDDYNDVSVTSANITVAKKEVEIDGITAGNKNYDGNPTATLVYSGVAFTGKVAADNITVTATGTFDNKNVSIGKTVTISNLALDSASDKKYIISSDSQDETLADISVATVTVTVNSDQFKYYGQDNPSEYTYTATGEIGTEKADFKGALSRDAGEEIALYTVIQNDLAIKDGTNGFLATNYTINYINTSKFEIKQIINSDVGYFTCSTPISSYGWYRNNVTLNAPVGYTINLSNAIGGAWSANVTDPDTSEGENKVITYYLKDTTGAISSAKTINYNLDKTAPTATIMVSANVWDTFLNTITFGLFFNTSQAVTIAPADSTNLTVNSSVAKTEYQIVNNQSEYNENGSWISGTSFTLNPTNKYIVYAKITDKADNYIVINSNGMIVNNVGTSVVLTPVAANANGLYKGDVNVDIAVSSASVYSGIKTVDYKVYNGATVTQSGNLFTFSVANPTYEQLQESWNGLITVDSSKNNSNNIVIEINVVDNADNIKTESKQLKIDITKPTISVSFNNNTSKKIVDDRGYFDASRTATVVITERNANFNATKATNGITITAIDSKGNTVNIPINKISSWTTNAGSLANNDDDTHTATVTYDVDANYTVSIAYTDEADNANTAVNYGTSVTPLKFTVDTGKPTGTITISGMGVWDRLIEVLTFGLWSKTTVDVSATADDVTSQIDSISTYKTDATTALTVAQLDAFSESAWTAYSPFSVEANEQFVVYVKIVDYAKNTEYISSNGVVVDNLSPNIDQLAPEITVTPPQPVNGIYDTNVKVDISVIDPMTSGKHYSGLKTITYQVLNTGVQKQEGTLFNFTTSDPTQSQLQQAWNGNITVDKTLNNSNYVDIKIHAVDNAGNTSDKVVSIKIDITNPKIDVVYDNNTFENDKYLGNNQNRKATITITELNFKNDDVVITVKKDEQPVTIIPNFVAVAQDTNNDNNKWEMEIDYSKYGDGDYTFDISYIDLAGNANAPVKYNSRDNVLATDTVFTIDNVKPAIEVVYDNNDAQNTNYYKAVRTATITVTEHNWRASDFVLQLKAENNTTGAYIVFDAPNLSGWTTNGDVHTSTITYTADGRYTFSVEYTDLAGNKSADFTEQVFFVDRTMPIVPKNITEISVANYVNGTNSTVAPKITVTDNNYDANAVTITLKGSKNGTVTLNETWAQAADNRGGTYTFPNFANEKAKDDIYNITVTIKDKAGNEISSGQIEFSVNRFGSTFDLKGLDTVNGGYFKTVQDVVIREINPNKVLNDTKSLSISRNGNIKELVSVTDYTVQPVETKGSWSEYTYTVKATNYKDDGKYITTLKNKDEANNANSSDDDTQSGTLVSFAIDNTKPTAAVSGIESGKMYSADSVKVTIAITDNIKIKGATIKLNGNVVTGTEIENTDTSNKIEISIPSDFNRQTLEITYLDEAGNENTTTIENFLVNSSVFVQYFQNKPLFFGSIGGLAVIILGLAAFFIFRKKKAIA